MRLLFPLILALLLPLSAISSARAADLVSPTLPREVVINGVELLLVPEGWFWYGFENGSRQESTTNRRPYFRDVKVWLDGFYIAKYEARATDFKRFMETDQVQHRADYWRGDTKGCSLRRNAAGEYVLVDPQRDMPITHLSWNLADEFSRWMGFRLPTEAQWVKAARGTDKRLWPWGDEYPDDTFAAYAGNGDCDPAPVSAFSKGRSPYGAYNMAGNMFEYVADWYNQEVYLGLKDGERNPVPAAQGSKIDDMPHPMKVLKGGRWASNSSATSIYGRNVMRADNSFVCYGVRFAVDLEAVLQHLAKGTATVTVP
jgi:formylglycine-generating enzyme required for sulfatase activity